MFQISIKKISNYTKSDLSGLIFHSLYLIKKKIRILVFTRIINIICRIKGVKLGKEVIFDGIPKIRRYPNSKIHIGNNCKFNSSRNSLSIGLYQPCTFVTLEENAFIIFGENSGASGLRIASRSSVTIGKNVLIGSGCTILDNDSHHSNPTKREKDKIPSRPIIIEDNVFIGLNSVILKGVTIGKNSVIGANSVVFNSIPENSIAIGNPCKVIIKRTL